MTKYIFITGGVISSLGKGLTSASIGALLESRGYKITIQKIDPYINVDPGTMSPYQHGEVYVTEDGAETDLDLGHYERFTNAVLSKANNTTTGKVYGEVIRRERKGEYLGKTVQVVPHITDEIKRRIMRLSDGLDIIITELGGTVGDIEGLPFLEAIRQMRLELPPEDTLCIHLTYVPFIRAAQEIKTKPTQHSVNKLREIGIQPDILICRSEKNLGKDVRAKIALFCNVRIDSVIEETDVESSIYEVPLMLSKGGVDERIIECLKMKPKKKSDLSKWREIVNRVKNPKHELPIAVIGKYIEHQDAYKSIYEALAHGAIANHCKLNIVRIEAEDIEKHGAAKYLHGVAGLLVPGGFGYRGIEGKVRGIQYVRERKIPFFGICLGMQCATIEFARNVCGLKNANSTEFDKETPHPVISLLSEQQNIVEMGGTMRLGAYPCDLKRPSKTYDAYKRITVFERHRHRYEFNNKYREIFEDKGMKIVGTYHEGNLVEIIELKNHPWFVGGQFHPEFKSKPVSAHPLFKAFIHAALKKHHSK